MIGLRPKIERFLSSGITHKLLLIKIEKSTEIRWNDDKIFYNFETN